MPWAFRASSVTNATSVEEAVMEVADRSLHLTLSVAPVGGR